MTNAQQLAHTSYRSRLTGVECLPVVRTNEFIRRQLVRIALSSDVPDTLYNPEVLRVVGIDHTPCDEIRRQIYLNPARTELLVDVQH